MTITEHHRIHITDIRFKYLEAKVLLFYILFYFIYLFGIGGGRDIMILFCIRELNRLGLSD